MEPSAFSQLLAFYVLDHHFVLDVRRIFEVLRAAQPVTVPGAHPAICGLLMWRGRSVPLISLRQVLFGRPASASDSSLRRWAIVLEAKGQLFALDVDGVDDVVQMRALDVLDDAHSPTAALSNFVLGCCLLAGRRYLLLDVRPLLALVAAPAPAPLALVSGRSL